MRRNIIRLVSLLAITSALAGCSLFKKPTGGLKVISNSISDVYLDTKNIGTTPLSKNPLEVKKYQLRLTPQDAKLTPYETQVKIFPGFESTVDWVFGATKEESSGFIFESESAHKRDASEIEIITSPDNVPVTINGENKGFTPLVLDSLTEGDYQLNLQAPGFVSAARGVRLIKGKRLLITAKLARKPIETASASAQIVLPTPAPIMVPPKVITKSAPKATSSGTIKITAKKPYVEVLDTPTGYLKVRSLPSVNGKELGRLNIGDAVSYGGTTTDNWFKIVYQATSSAWVSGQYSKLVQ